MPSQTTEPLGTGRGRLAGTHFASVGRVSWGRKVLRRIATALAIKLTLRLLSRVGMGAAIASFGWLVGIAVSLGLLVVEEVVIVGVDRLQERRNRAR